MHPHPQTKQHTSAIPTHPHMQNTENASPPPPPPQQRHTHIHMYACVHTHTHTHTTCRLTHHMHTHTQNMHSHTVSKLVFYAHTHSCTQTHTQHAQKIHTPWLTYEMCPGAAEAYKQNQKHRRTEAATPLSLCGSPQGGGWGLGLRCRRTGRCTCKLATALLVTAEPLTKVHHSYL